MIKKLLLIIQCRLFGRHFDNKWPMQVDLLVNYRAMQGIVTDYKDKKKMTCSICGKKFIATLILKNREWWVKND